MPVLRFALWSGNYHHSGSHQYSFPPHTGWPAFWLKGSGMKSTLMNLCQMRHSDNCVAISWSISFIEHFIWGQRLFIWFVSSSNSGQYYSFWLQNSPEEGCDSSHLTEENRTLWPLKHLCYLGQRLWLTRNMPTGNNCKHVQKKSQITNISNYFSDP